MNHQDSNKIPENPLRMCNSDREEEDYLLRFSELLHATAISIASVHTQAVRG
jgi:hypothetical protein